MKRLLFACLVFLSGCADVGSMVGNFAEGYANGYNENQAAWNRLNEQQQIQRLQWQEEQHYNQMQFQHNMERLQAGLPPD
jgi:hypothetical protein